MNQTRLESFIESSINIGSGFVVSLLFWTFVVVPMWHLPVSMHNNLQITGCFTILSVARSYVWRRLFNNGMHKRLHRLVSRLRRKP